MAPFRRLEEPPSEEVLRAALARLCTKGLRTYWILEPDGHVLLGLECVQAHLEPAESEAKDKDYAIALRQYLEDPVQRVQSPAHRAILEVVLGLGEPQWKTKDWRREKAKIRRQKAGSLFRGPDDDEAVEADTIRQYHEPRAIGALAKIVLEDEMKARAARAKQSA
jgi:hypothetical protein